MRRGSRTWALAVGAVVLALSAAPCMARPSQGGGQTELRASISRDDAASIVERSTGGRVLAVETTDRNGKPVYRVKVLLPGGRMRIVTVDGQTGNTD